MFFEEKHSKANYQTTLRYHNMETILHCQTSYELLFVIEGTVEAVRQSQSFLLTSGSCIWILPYEIHTYHTIAPNQAVVFIFSPDWMPDFDLMVRESILRNPVIPFRVDELQLLDTGQPDRLLKKSVLYRLASAVLVGGLEKRAMLPLTDPTVRIMLYIQRHFREDVTLADLAQELGYSYHYTSRIISASFSMGFSELVTEYRLDEAAKLLRNPDAVMSRVAADAGFSTIRSFNLAFRRCFHMSPSEYRATLAL